MPNPSTEFRQSGGQAMSGPHPDSDTWQKYAMERNGAQREMAVCQNLVPLVNIKIAGKWMFIPLKMVLVGIDPYPDVNESSLLTTRCARARGAEGWRPKIFGWRHCRCVLLFFRIHILRSHHTYVCSTVHHRLCLVALFWFFSRWDLMGAVCGPVGLWESPVRLQGYSFDAAVQLTYPDYTPPTCCFSSKMAATIKLDRLFQLVMLRWRLRAHVLRCKNWRSVSGHSGRIFNHAVPRKVHRSILVVCCNEIQSDNRFGVGECPR